MEFKRVEDTIRLKKTVHTLIEEIPPIIKMWVNDHEFLEVDDVRAMREVNLSLSEGKPFCVLLDTGEGYFNLVPEAAKLLNSKEYAEKRMAAAFIVKSLASRLAGNFFIRMGGRYHHTRMFSEETEALKWLKTFGK